MGTVVNSGGINLSTDSYLPPEVRVRLVRLVTQRHYTGTTVREALRDVLGHILELILGDIDYGRKLITTFFFVESVV